LHVFDGVLQLGTEFLLELQVLRVLARHVLLEDQLGGVVKGLDGTVGGLLGLFLVVDFGDVGVHA
jgi:hypothetical protein